MPFDLSSAADYGYDVAAQPDGKIIVAGTARWSGLDHDFAVALLLAGTPILSDGPESGRHAI